MRVRARKSSDSRERPLRTVFYAPICMRGRGSTGGTATFFSVFAVVTVVAFADGGYFRETWVWLTLAFACLIWITLLMRDTIALGRLELVALAAFGSFVGWVGLSAMWSPTPTESVEEAERALVYVAGLLAAALLVDRDRLRQYYSGIAAATVVVAAYSVSDRLHGATPGRDPTQGTLLIEPLGYANALGIAATLGTLLSLGLATTACSWVERVAWVAALPVLTLVLIQTESRGALFALAIGLCVLAILSWKLHAHLREVRRPLVVAALAGILALTVVAISRVDRPLGPRVDYWTVALNQWKENIWLGSGAGTFALYWLREGSTSVVLDAHSLYLETLAEIGPIGFLLLIGALGLPMFAAARSRDRSLAAVGGAAYAAYLVHAGLDWDWEMPAVTLIGLLCGIGVLAADRRGATEITIAPSARRGLALAALVLACLGVAAAVAH